jgi:osmotically-inducible protein OsmY
MKQNFTPTHNPIAAAPVDPPRGRVSDEELLLLVAQTLAMDGRLGGESFGVDVKDGCAILTGEISREFLRTLVDATISAVPGILVIKNQLAVRQVGPMAWADK